MPLYFAYGANLDRIGMKARCPEAHPLGTARLDAHRFFVMASGYASVRPEPGAAVHGLLWRVTAADLTALDLFEEVEAGLYRRGMAAVVYNGSVVEALLYQGCSAATGPARLGYLEAVVAAAVACGLPRGYCAELRNWPVHRPFTRPPG